MSKRYRAILVEDEALARDRLREMLRAYSHVLDVIGEASDGSEGLEMIELLKPDLVFLDVQMPVLNGFEMLQNLEHTVKVIFTTAYDQYAIKAFEENSIDYLLKPIEEERLAKSMDKLSRLHNIPDAAEIRSHLSENEMNRLETLAVRLGHRFLLISTCEVIYFHAEDKYVNVCLTSGESHLISLSLTELEKRLPPEFMRIHRSFILNKKFIKEVHRGTNGKLDFVMRGKNEKRLTSSQTYTPEVRRVLGL